jgi:hypothetical protein
MVESEPARMALLHDSWKQWWENPPPSDAAQLQSWVEELQLEGPPEWRWKPSAEVFADILRHLPATSAGQDGIPYAAWHSLEMAAPRLADRTPSWISEFFRESVEEISTCEPGDMPDDFNSLLCHVLGKPPKTMTPEGVLRRGPADTRIIEVGSTENRIIARGVCQVMTQGPIGDWFDPDQHAWLPGRYGLQAIMRVDFEQCLATLRGDEGPLGLGDLEKAFPSVLLDGLMALLRQLGAPPDFLRLLQNLYERVRRWSRGP